MDNIKAFFRRIKWDSIIVSLLSIAIGILCVVMPDRAGDVLCLVYGASLIAISVALFVSYFVYDRLFGAHLLITAVVTLILGIFCLVYPNALQNILTVLLGLFIVIDSASSLADSMYCAKAKIRGWSVLFVLSILTAALGVSVMFANFDAVMIFAGCALIFEGVKRFVLTIVYSRKIKAAKKKLYQKEDIIDIN